MKIVSEPNLFYCWMTCMKINYRTIVCLIQLALLTACGTPPVRSEFSPCALALKPEMGRIYVYRTEPKSLGIPPRVIIDDKVYEELWPRHSYYLDVEPGVHKLHTDMSDATLEVNVEKGKKIIVKYVLDPAWFGKGFYPILVDYQEGSLELKEHTGSNIECER